MSVDTIYDPMPEITPSEKNRPERGGDDRIDDFDGRVPN